MHTASYIILNRFLYIRTLCSKTIFSRRSSKWKDIFTIFQNSFLAPSYSSCEIKYCEKKLGMYGQHKKVNMFFGTFYFFKSFYLLHWVNSLVVPTKIWLSQQNNLFDIQLTKCFVGPTKFCCWIFSFTQPNNFVVITKVFC